MNPIQPADTGVDPAVRDALRHEPRGTTLIEVAAGPATHYGALPAICFSPDGQACEELSWQELWAGAAAAAVRLAPRLRGRQEPVIQALPTSPAFFYGFFGTLAAGGVPVPVALPTSLKVSRLEAYTELMVSIARDAGARTILTTARYEALLAEPLAATAPDLHVSVVDDAPPPGEGWTAAEVRPDDLALLQYTSGSTSRPKGVALTHANVLANAEIIAAAIVPAGTAGVSWLPLYHDMGLIGGALSALYARCSILLMPTTLFVKEPASWIRAIGAFRGTVTLAPNFAYQHAVKSVSLEQVEGTSLASLQNALNGAEPVDVAVVEAFEEKFAAIGLRRGTVRAVYGLAESTLAVTFADPGVHLVDEIDADILERAGRAVVARPPARTRRFAAVGPPLPTQELRIVDERDVSLGEREIGEVVVRGPSIMQGYYNRPEETAATLRGGWLHTGDLGYLAGGRLYLTGRSRDLIIRYGRNYYPSDIESVVNQTEGVGRGGSVAFGAGQGPDERVVVVAETRLRRAEDLALLARRIRERCHDAFLFGPDDVCLVPTGSIPRTTSGKVRRHECKARYARGELRTTPDD